MINILDYFDDEKIKSKYCVVSNPKKRFVFKEEVNGEVYFIKKYTPHGKKAIRINLYLKRDRALHYRYISNLLKKLDIPHAEPVEVKIKKKNFFKRESIVITKYGGETLEEELKKLNFLDQKKLIDEYFNYFIKMFNHKIYITDYNLSGMLLDSEKKMKLIDFDGYRKQMFLTKKLKSRICEELYKGNDMRYIGGYSEEICQYMERKIKEVLKIIGLENIKNKWNGER